MDAEIVDTLSDDELEVLEGARVEDLADTRAGLFEVGEKRNLRSGGCETLQDASLRRGHEVESLRETIAWACRTVGSGHDGRVYCDPPIWRGIDGEGDLSDAQCISVEHLQNLASFQVERGKNEDDLGPSVVCGNGPRQTEFASLRRAQTRRRCAQRRVWTCAKAGPGACIGTRTRQRHKREATRLADQSFCTDARMCRCGSVRAASGYETDCTQ